MARVTADRAVVSASCESGLELVASFQHVLAEIGSADFWLSALESFRKLIPKAGAVSVSGQSKPASSGRN